MQVSRTRLLVAGVAAGLAGVLALAAAQASSASSAQSVASPGKTAPAAGSPGDAAAKRAAAAREERGSGGSPADAAAKRAAAAQERHGSGSDNLLRRPDAAGSIARSLGVSDAAVRAALRTLVPLSEASDGLDVASHGFVAAAAQLGVSPAQLARAIGVLKEAG